MNTGADRSTSISDYTKFKTLTHSYFPNSFPDLLKNFGEHFQIYLHLLYVYVKKPVF